MIATDAALAIANFFNVPGIVGLQQTYKCLNLKRPVKNDRGSG